MNKLKTAVVIGAGPAGLTAGYELINRTKEYRVIILEETHNIGGISQTVRYNGNRMDIGGHRFFSKNARVMRWWTDIFPKQGAPAFDDGLLNRKKPVSENGPDPEKKDEVMLLRDRVSRIYYAKRFFDYPVSLNPETFINMGFVTTIKAIFSYFRSVFRKLPETSLENFYINRFGRKLYSMFFENYTEKLWGRHPREISADWGAQRVKGLSVFAVLRDIIMKIIPSKSKRVETSLIEQFLYPKYGPGQLWEKIAAEIVNLGGEIRTGCKVTELSTNSSRIKSVTYEKCGKDITLSADIFISSMPVKDLIAGIGRAVPADIRKTAFGLPYRDFVTVGLLVNKLKLKNKTKYKTLNNIVPDCWIYVQEPEVKLGRIQIFNNWSPYMAKDPVNTVWLGLEYFCSENDDFWSLTDDDCIELAISELVKIGIIDRENVIDGHRVKIKKAYPAYFDTYKDFHKVVNYINKFNNLFCVGRNGQHRYNNMDHSMATAFETVDNIINGINNKSNIWNVNTEKKYHETK